MDPGVTQLGYVVMFGFSAVGCLVGAARASRLEAPAVRRGLVGLLVLTAAWALLEMARLLTVAIQVKTWLYAIGLVIGLAAVFVWLYFVSAYTGAGYHENPRLRAAAVAVFLVVSTVKLTNPFHGWYFSATITEFPFPHLLIDQHPIHWVVVAGVYVAVGAGFLRLFRTLRASGYDTTWLGVLAAAAAVPVGPSLVANAQPNLLLEVNYEPVGVALFSLGALYVVEDTFVAIGDAARRQVIERVPPAIVVVDREACIVDYDGQAEARFPSLPGLLGRPVTELHPALTPGGEDSQVIDVAGDEGTAHYLVTDTPVSLGGHDVGHSFVLSEVTELERQRREVARQNRQLDELAAAMSHELRNPLNVVLGELTTIEDGIEHASLNGSTEETLAALDRVEQATRRMVTVVDDVQRLAAQGKSLDDTDRYPLGELCEEAWVLAETGDSDLVVERDGEILANRSRFKQLLVGSLEYLATGSETVAVRLDGDRLVLTGVGRDSPGFDLGALFEHGYAAGADRDRSRGDGASLTNVRTLAKVHGWSVSAVDIPGGLCFVVEGVEGETFDPTEPAEH